MLLWRMTGILINWLKFQIWQTTYYHIVNSQEGVIEWYKDSGLRPYFEMLENDEKAEFLSLLQIKLEKLFPTEKDGKVILKMPRLSFTLQKRWLILKSPTI